jgi:hypothetical protein
MIQTNLVIHRLLLFSRTSCTDLRALKKTLLTDVDIKSFRKRRSDNVDTSSE